MAAPILIKTIPSQVINELAAFGPFDLSPFIQTPDHSPFRFRAELDDGQSLPKGLICLGEGVITGIPAKNTEGYYEIVVTAENEAGSISTSFLMTIQQGLAQQTTNYNLLKSEVWEALENNMPIPDLMEAYGRPITIMEIYYLLERWSVLRIWDVFNLDAPGEKILLNLEGASKHFNVYDRGSCLIASPKELYSNERTLEDGLQTARAMIREAFKRSWTIELVGFDKLKRAAWVEIQRLRMETGKSLEIINYVPTKQDIELYTNQVVSLSKPEMEQ